MAKGSHADGPPRRRVVVVGVVLLVLALALAAAAAAFSALAPREPAGDGMEPNVVVGTMEGYSDEDVAALLADKVDKGMIAFSLNTSMHLEAPGAQAAVKFENPPNNAKLTRLRLVRDDTGETVYETGFLAPGSYVDSDALDVELPPGEHACTGYVTSYELDTRKYLGEAACAVTVTVAGQRADGSESI